MPNAWDYEESDVAIALRASLPGAGLQMPARDDPENIALSDLDLIQSSLVDRVELAIPRNTPQAAQESPHSINKVG